VLLCVGVCSALAGGCGGKSRLVELSPGGNGSGGVGGTSGARGGESGQGSETSIALESFDDALRVARCAREQRCGPFWMDERTCVEEARTYPFRLRFESGVDYGRLLAATYRLGSAEALDACLLAIDEVPCDDERTPFLTCREALIARRQGGEGDACRIGIAPWNHTPTCEAGLTCETWDTCGTCVPDVGGVEGSACQTDGECAAGFWCLPTSHTCGAVSTLPKEGERCLETARCAVGTMCLSGQRCIRPPRLGEPCNPRDIICQRGLTCEEGEVAGSGTCEPLGRRGEPCTRSPGFAANSCIPALVCVFDEADALTGTCGDYPPPAPGPCVRAGSAVYFTCPGIATYSDPSPAAMGEAPAFCDCLPTKPLGQACARWEECDTRNCDNQFDTPGHCFAPMGVGAVCYSDFECASGECGGMNRCVTCE
jgi:hypothetical protein